MLKEVREELDRIEQFLMRRDVASADLAKILSALRGEDKVNNSDGSEKMTTTARIRTAAFPKLAKANTTEWTTPFMKQAPFVAGWAMARAGEEVWDGAVVVEMSNESTHHFRGHIKDAVWALNRPADGPTNLNAYKSIFLGDDF